MTERQSIAKRGEKNPMCKLTQEQVNEIKEYSRKNMPWGWKSTLARRFHVGPALIWQIANGLRWKD